MLVYQLNSLNFTKIFQLSADVKIFILNNHTVKTLSQKLAHPLLIHSQALVLTQVSVFILKQIIFKKETDDDETNTKRFYTD
jgi:hypothetical protein